MAWLHEWLQSFGNGKYMEKIHWNTMTTILPNNFELLSICFSWSVMRIWEDCCFNDQVLSDAVTFQEIPNFFLYCPCRFSAYWENLFCLFSNFFIGLPFEFLAYRDAFFPKPPFWVFNLASCYFISLGEVFLDCIVLKGRGKSSQSIVSRINAPQEKAFLSRKSLTFA